jgi:N-acetylneuraminic acid mutarotase
MCIYYRDSDSPPSPRCRHAAAAFGNKMIIFGGQSKVFSPIYLNDMYIFDTVTLKWTTIEYRSLPDKSLSENFTSLSDPITSPSKKIQKEEKNVIPCGRAGHTLTLINSHLYLFGGFGEDGHHHSDLWVFSPITLSWQQIVTPPEGTPGGRLVKKKKRSG